MTKFKDKNQQKAYDLKRGYTGWLNHGSLMANAYRNGRNGLRSSWPKNSIAYAAWAAGRDDYRQAQRSV